MKDIFCRIIEGEIPCTKVYEDDDVLAFLDISQVTVGHTLVVPKAHYENFLATPKETMEKVYAVAQRIGQAMMGVLHAEGVNVLTNVGEAAGQTVMHFHVHVIPRYKEISPNFQITMEGSDTSKLDLPRIACQIKEAIH